MSPISQTDLLHSAIILYTAWRACLLSFHVACIAIWPCAHSAAPSQKSQTTPVNLFFHLPPPPAADIGGHGVHIGTQETCFHSRRKVQYVNFEWQLVHSSGTSWKLLGYRLNEKQLFTAVRQAACTYIIEALLFSMGPNCKWQQQS